MSGPTNMPIAPSAYTRHVDAWKQCPRFPLDAKVRVISTHNPWRPNAIAWNLFEQVLRKKNDWTVGEILDAAEAVGYFRTDVMSFLRWLYTWGDFIEVSGGRYFPVKEPEPVVVAVVKQRKTRKGK